ncbi:MAG: aminotransferase class V-fold PLP-dependent enzyme [Thermomicrobiales bacterium]
MPTEATAPQETAETVEAPEDLKRYYLLDPNITFLNHGSFGACPIPVFEQYQAWQRELERQPVLFIGRRQDGLLNAARARLAEFVNVDPDNLVYVTNATVGVNIVARSIRLEPGDEILGTSLEYGACGLAWKHLCAKSGATYVEQDIPVPFTTQEAIVEALWQGVTPNTKAIYLSHITSGTAVIMPVEAICARAKAAGILTIVDGAHAPGQIPLDLTAMGVDIYTGNCHKWLQAPKGAAFLYVRPEHQAWIESEPISWGWAREDHTFVTRNQGQATRDVSAYLSVPAAIDFQQEHHWPAVRARSHAMLAAFRDRMHARLGTEPLYPSTPAWFSQMALVTLPSTIDRATLQTRLYEEFGIEIPVSGYRDTIAVRVSVQGYVGERDLATLEAALVAIYGEAAPAT